MENVQVRSLNSKRLHMKPYIQYDLMILALKSEITKIIRRSRHLAILSCVTLGAFPKFSILSVIVKILGKLTSTSQGLVNDVNPIKS